MRESANEQTERWQSVRATKIYMHCRCEQTKTKTFSFVKLSECKRINRQLDSILSAWNCVRRTSLRSRIMALMRNSVRDFLIDTKQFIRNIKERPEIWNRTVSSRKKTFERAWLEMEQLHNLPGMLRNSNIQVRILK
jgi:hypothetical protein